jgi:hypothetical protein
MSARNVLSKIPWEDILKYSPIIAETGGKIYNSVKKYFGETSIEGGKPPKVSLEQLGKRVKLLELNELEQADLLDKIAVQINELSNASKIISNRTLLALSISSLSLVFSLVLFIIIYVK